MHEAKVSAGHADRTRLRFEQDVFPWLGRRLVAEIEAPELLQCLRRIEGRGAIETAHRAKDSCGRVFRFAIASGLCKRDVAADLKDALRPVPTRHHAAIVDPTLAAALLRDMEAYQGHPVTRAALALSALLLLRPGELRHREWAWVDLDAALLTVPGSVMKRTKADKADGPPHLVPLAPQAVEILRTPKPVTGHGRYVFPAPTTGERRMSENTVRSALRRLGYANDDMTAHGFRAMVRTMIAERLGVAPEVIEAQLAHAVAGPLGRAYDRTTVMDQRTDMMTRWGQLPRPAAPRRRRDPAQDERLPRAVQGEQPPALARGSRRRGAGRSQHPTARFPRADQAGSSVRHRPWARQDGRTESAAELAARQPARRTRRRSHNEAPGVAADWEAGGSGFDERAE